MNNCNCNHDCRSNRCKSAPYDMFFDIETSPYDQSTWIVTWNGATKKIKIPTISETDTFISTNNTNATLLYKAERHEDVLTGSQLGDLINIGDLRDMSFDSTLSGTCYELGFKKYGNCGDGCTSLEDSWYNFNINSDGVKKDNLRFIRGTNVYGCPEYLDVPSNLNQFWFAGWKTNGDHKQFGYFQPDSASTLPTDGSGNALVMSVNATTKKPIIAPLKVTTAMLYADAVCSNIVPASGFAVSDGGGHSICYYPHIGVAKVSIDFVCTTARNATTYFDLVIGTIENHSLWTSGYMDLPTHWVWNNNSDGAITPVALRFNSLGQLVLSGSVPPRTTTGKASFIALGVDDAISYSPVGSF